MLFMTGKERMTTQKGVHDNGAGLITGGMIKGMSGQSSGTSRDLGVERTIGAGKSAGVKKYNKESVLKLDSDDKTMSGAGFSGGKKTTPWLALVKKICSERKATVGEAIKYIKANNLYKK